MHAEYLHRRVVGAEVVGVFDVSAEAAAAVSADLGVPALGSLDDALALDADAVAICTSTDTHVDCMIAAAEAGRAIFCEKPISLDVTEVDRGLGAVEAANVALHIGFNRRFDPSHRSVAEAVARGVIGDV
jgi:myo-inositol 2-dehydrogenase/D-chiro-inositol 1-dehydrogenase